MYSQILSMTKRLLFKKAESMIPKNGVIYDLTNKTVDSKIEVKKDLPPRTEIHLNTSTRFHKTANALSLHSHDRARNDAI